MGRDTEVKNILDSVHVQIKIPKEWCEKIIDTPYFQRLRRIEQNSCRSVFPSARHDRFIHSLGVYHIGTLIARHLESQCEIPEFEYSILDTYRLACLLHDVGHTPFSHTFEEYFNETELRKALSEALDDAQFNSDLGARTKRLTEHELLSAYIAIKVFKGILSDDDKIDWPLLTRMIIGLPYVDAKDRKDNTRFVNSYMGQLMRMDLIMYAVTFGQVVIIILPWIFIGLLTPLLLQSKMKIIVLHSLPKLLTRLRVF